MDETFFNIEVDPKLICNFLAVFSRMEYSLKATEEYICGSEKKVEPKWDSFANDINEIFLQIKDEDAELKSAVDYLIKYPPKKQIIDDGKLIFQERKLEKGQKLTQQILLMVRTIRNNLFHGGKYYKNTKDRDLLLIKHSLKIYLYVLE